MILALTEERSVTLSAQEVQVLAAVTMLYIVEGWQEAGGATIGEGRCAAAFRLFKRFQQRVEQPGRKEFRMGFDTEERGLLAEIIGATYPSIGTLERSVATQVMMELGVRS